MEKTKTHLIPTRDHIIACIEKVGGITKLCKITGFTPTSIKRWKTNTEMKGNTAIRFEKAINDHLNEDFCDRLKLLAWFMPHEPTCCCLTCMDER